MIEYELQFLAMKSARDSLEKLGYKIEKMSMPTIGSKLVLTFSNACVAGEIILWRGHRFNIIAVITDPLHPLSPPEPAPLYEIDEEYDDVAFRRRLDELLAVLVKAT